MDSQSWEYLAAGLAAAVATYRVLGHVLAQSAYEVEFWRQAQQRRRRRRNAWSGGSSSAGALRTASLGHLALHADFRLRRAAAELLYDSAVRGRVAALAVRTARAGGAADRRRAVALLQALAQAPGRQRRLVRAGALEALVACMRSGDKELALRAAAALAEFVGRDDAGQWRARAAAAGALDAVAMALGSDGAAAMALGSDGAATGTATPNRNNADSATPNAHDTQPAAPNRNDSDPTAPNPHDAVAVTVCAGIAKLYAQRAQFHGAMVRRGFLGALLRVARRAGADVELARVALEALVRLCAGLSGGSELERLLRAGAGDVVAASVAQDDQGVASWGIGLLHEFVSRGVGTAQLARPALVRALCRRLSTAKYAYTNQLVLRSLWGLAPASRAALRAVAEPRCLRRVLAVFAVDDADAHHWGVALVARAAADARTHAWLVASPLPRALRDMAARLPQALRATLLPEIASIVARLARSPALAHAPHAALADTCRLLLASDVENARLGAIMAVINASSAARAFLRAAVSDRVRAQLLAMAADCARATPQSYAAKALAALLPAAAVRADALAADAFVPCARALAEQLPAWPAARAAMHCGIASVLLAALPVLAAAGSARVFANDSVLAALFALQRALLAHAARALAFLLRLPAAVDAPPACARAPAALDAFIVAYYAATPADPHARAARAAQRASVRQGFAWSDAGGAWPDGPSNSNGSDNLDSSVARAVLPGLRATLTTLADSLDPALPQHPAIARQSLQLMRVLARELPALRDVAMRVLAALDPRALPADDAAGRLRLLASALPAAPAAVRCAAAVARRLPPAAPLPPAPAPAQPVAAASDDAARVEQLPSGVGVAEDAELTPEKFLERFPELDPASVAQGARVHAQFAVDRHAAGWRTAAELHACVEPAARRCWIIDRSGPRGAAMDLAPTLLRRPPPAAGNTAPSAATTDAADNTGPPAAIADAADTTAPRAPSPLPADAALLPPPQPLPASPPATL
ncbi:hypothetical protein LPJ70_002064, partial [Coemansia sp. RSA 2708]